MSLLKNFDYSKFKKDKLPKSNSLETFKEIKQIDRLSENKKFVKDHDDVTKVFVGIVGKENKKYIQELLDSSRPIIVSLKKYYNRPRPKVLAKNFDIKLKDIELDSMKTPSYPSGHSTQGYLVAEMLKVKYPEKAKELNKKAKDISDSRNIAKAHYKSDSTKGKALGLEMASFIKQQQNG